MLKQNNEKRTRAASEPSIKQRAMLHSYAQAKMESEYDWPILIQRPKTPDNSPRKKME